VEVLNMNKEISIVGREPRARLTARQRANLELLLLEIEISINNKQQKEEAAQPWSLAPGCESTAGKVLCHA
jgi:hypothetical protein